MSSRGNRGSVKMRKTRHKISAGIYGYFSQCIQSTAGSDRICDLREVKEGLFQEVFGAADVLGDGVGRVVAAAEASPFLGTQTSSGVASTGVGACIDRSHAPTWRPAMNGT